MRGTTMKAASICTALLGLSALTVACGDPDPVTPDSGPGPRDSGQDSGGEVDAGETPDDAGSDAGTDAGGPTPSHLRLAHLIPGGPPVHICLQIPAGAGGWLLITRDPVSREPSAIPYKGVSGYTDFPLPEVDLGVAVYPSDVAGLSAGTCPTATTAAIITATLNGGDFDPGAYYTVAATGIVGGTAEAAPELNVLADDLVAPTTAGNTRLRFYHAVPNFPVTVVGVDLCFDPDGAGTTAPEELIENASFEEINDYLEHTPLTAGLLSLHAYNPAAENCSQTPVTTVGGTRLALIPVPIPLPATSPANYTATFAADTSNTIFLIGDASIVVNPATTCTVDADCAAAGPAGTVCNTAVGRCSHPNGVSIVPIQDSLGLTL